MDSMAEMPEKKAAGDAGDGIKYQFTVVMPNLNYDVPQGVLQDLYQMAQDDI